MANPPDAHGNDQYDLTGHIGPMFTNAQPPEWPMYSFDRPAHILWNAIAKELHAAGWSNARIKDWLQSKSTRWALDGTLGDMIASLGTDYAKTISG